MENIGAGERIDSGCALRLSPLRSGSNHLDGRRFEPVPQGRLSAHKKTTSCGGDVVLENIGAGERIRTVDIDLGKVALYH